MAKRRVPKADFDSPWKVALGRFLPAFLAFFYPNIYADIDWSKGLVSLDTEFHRITRGARSKKSLADKLFKVWRLNGEETWLLIHIEVQSAPEDDFPLRMFRYNTRAFDLYNQTVVSLAVLTDEQPSWRPERFDYGEWGASTGIRFLSTKLLDWRGREADLAASDNPFAKVVLAHLRALQTREDPQSRSRFKLEVVKGLYQYGWTPEKVYELFEVIDWLLDLPSEFDDNFTAELHVWEEEKRMPYITSVERFGIKKGLKQGLQEGLLKGIAAVLTAKFGKADKRVLAKARAIQSVEELQALLEAIPACATIQEIRERLPDRPD